MELPDVAQALITEDVDFNTALEMMDTDDWKHLGAEGIKATPVFYIPMARMYVNIEQLPQLEYFKQRPGRACLIMDDIHLHSHSTAKKDGVASQAELLWPCDRWHAYTHRFAQAD